ncbi:MAG: hypothetical protein JXA30_14735, partial [Deltaproteobacteria bacterium]|nr:hypothetical protein [Deltaproteobacteria bacterium]
ASTILVGPAGALGFTGELAADLFAPLNAYVERGILHAKSNTYSNNMQRYLSRRFIHLCTTSTRLRGRG